MKTIVVVIFCVVAVSNAIPLSDSTKEVYASTFDSNGPQPVDEIIAITNGEEEKSSKRVARHYGYGYGGGYGYPVGVAYVQSYPVYYGGGYGGGYYGGGGYGYGGGWGRGHHHHHRHW